MPLFQTKVIKFDIGPDILILSVILYLNINTQDYHQFDVITIFMKMAIIHFFN